MGKKLVFIALIALLGGCATASTPPPTEGVKVEAGFPSPGTKWVYQTVDQAGATTRVVYTALDEATY